jgi:hypothetical protein
LIACITSMRVGAAEYGQVMQEALHHLHWLDLTHNPDGKGIIRYFFSSDCISFLMYFSRTYFVIKCNF